MAVVFEKFILPKIGQQTHKTLIDIESDFFKTGPLKNITRFDTELIEKLKDTDEFEKHYIMLRKCRAYTRMGAFKEAYVVMTELQSKLMPEGFESDTLSLQGKKVDADAILFLDWVLVAKKVLYRQFF